jgi:hypothetical protein
LVTPQSSTGIEQLTSILSSQDSTLALAAFEDLETQPPSKFLTQTLAKILPKVTNPILLFQGKKTLRLLNLKLLGPLPEYTSERIIELAQDEEAEEDLALALTCLPATEGFLAIDLFREKDWSDFSDSFLPTLCRFIKKFGGNSDSPRLIELTRHADPAVVTAALDALEVLDPTNLQSLVTPLLDSPIPGIRAKAVQSIYRWSKALALSHLTSMLFSENLLERNLALFHAGSFPLPEVEPHLLRFLAEVSEPKQLLVVNQIFKRSVYVDLPFKIFWIYRSLRGDHQNLVKGIIIGLIRTLSEKKIIDCSPEEFLKHLKIRIRDEEERRLRASMSLDPDEKETQPGPEPEHEPESFSGAEPEETRSGTDDATAPTKGSQPGVDVVASTTSRGIRYFSVHEYDQLSGTDKIQLLSRLSREDYEEFRSKVPSLLRTAEGKELASLVRVVGRFGTQQDGEKMKRYINTEDPDLVCSAIDALSHLDPDYLAIFLPQLMQSRNGKIRIKATRTFASIDTSQIKSLITGMLKSVSPKQRSMAVNISTLVDFSLVRGPLVTALAKENSLDIVEKMGLLICANPDRDLFRQVYRLSRQAGKDVVPALEKMTLQLAETLSIALDKISSPAELLAEEEKTLEAETTPPPTASSTASGPSKSDPSRSAAAAPAQVDSGGFFTSSSPEIKGKRATVTLMLFVLAGSGWLLMLLTILLGK